MTDWLIQSKRASEIAQGKGQKGSKPFNYGRDQLSKSEQTATPVAASTAVASAAKARKLSFKEQRELEALPSAIAALEAEHKAIHEALADGSLYASDHTRAVQMAERSAQIDDELMQALERWEALGG